MELPLIEVLASMEVEGFNVDKATLENFGLVLKEEIVQLEKVFTPWQVRNLTSIPRRS